MKIGERDKSKLKGLITSPEWNIIKDLMAQFAAEMRANPKTDVSSVDKTALTTARDEGMADGVIKFQNDLWEITK